MSDPKRLLHEGGELSRLLQAAERDVIDDDAVKRLRTRLAAAGAVTAGATAATGKTSAAAMSTLGSKLAALALVATTVGAGYFMLHHSAKSVSVSVSAPVSISVSVSASASVSVPASASVSDPVSVSVPASAAPPPPLARPVPRPKPLATTEPAPAATTPREGLLLLQARQSLTTDPTRALTLVQQHEAEFPASQLTPERNKLRSEAEAKVRKETSSP